MILELADATLYDGLPYGFFAMGLVLTYRYLRFIDLTFASSFILGPAIVAAISNVMPKIPWISISSIWVSIPLAVIATIVLSLLTSFQIQKLRIDSLLASLLSSLVGFSMTLIITKGVLPVDPSMNLLSELKEIDRSIGTGIQVHPLQITVFIILLLISKLSIDVFLASEKGLVFRSLEDENSAGFLLPSLGLNPYNYSRGGPIAGNILSFFSGLLIMYKETQVVAGRGFDVFLTVIVAYLLGTTLFMKSPETWSYGHNSTRWKVESVLQTLNKLKKLNPTSASLIGIVLYFFILSLVAHYPHIPGSLPKALIVFFILVLLYLFELPEISRKKELSRLNKTFFQKTATALEVKNATVAFPGFLTPTLVLTDASFRFPLGKVTQLIGPNGSGKSTLMQYLSGYLDGTGEVFVPVVENFPDKDFDRKTTVCYIPQHAKLSTCSFLTVEEHFALYHKGRKVSGFQQIQKNLTFEGGENNTLNTFFNRIRKSPVAVLSGGERQILSIGSLFLRSDFPKMVLFDEPLSYLDETNAQVCVDLIEKLVQRGCGVVLIQHDIQPNTINNKSKARTKLSQMINQQVDIRQIQGTLLDGK